MSDQPDFQREIPSFENLAADPEIAPLLRFEPFVRKVRRPDGWTPELQRELIARLEPQADEPYQEPPPMRDPHLLLTAESGWLWGELGYGPSKVEALRAAIDKHQGAGARKDRLERRGLAPRPLAG